MDQQFKTLMANAQAPAVGVTIVQGDQTLICKAHGLADVEHNISATPASVFKLASVTKQFTAFAIMRLIELDLLSLTSPVKDVLPLVSNLHSGITVKHLLNHTSGIPNYTELPDRFKPFETSAATHAQMLSVFIDQPLIFEPGHGYEYSNSGYYLLGLIIEHVSGKAYDTYLQDEFFKPLGMENTSYADDRRIIRNRVKGYDAEHGNTPETGLLNCEYIHMNPPFAAGAICSTLEDMTLWTKAILQKKIVSEQSFALMGAPTKLLTGEQTNYGFGFESYVKNGRFCIGHGGAIPGFMSMLMVYPEQDLAIVVLTNSTSSEPWLLEEKIAAYILD